VPGADRAGRQDQGTYRDAEVGNVGDQMGGVGEQSQRPEHDPAGDLDEQQGGVDAQCPAQCAALPGARDVGAVLERMPGDLSGWGFVCGHGRASATRTWGLWAL
jgi:hypothetical protein